MSNKSQRLVALKAENFKRLRAVDIEFSSNVVTLSGRNEQGKSSVLDAIWWALAGGSAAKTITNPIRNGETKATVEVTLDDFVITRSASVDRKTASVTVTNRDGSQKFSSPQKLLDALIGKLSFDPLEFSRMDVRSQREALLNSVDLGIDLDALEKTRGEAFALRTDVNRSVKNLKAQVEGIVIPADMPAPVDTAALMQELQVSQAAARAKDDSIRLVSSLEMRVQQMIQDLENAKAELHTARTASLQAIDDAGKHRDPELIQEAIAGAGEANKASDLVRERDRLSKMLADETAQAEELSKQIEALDKTKSDALAAAEMPIEGLGVDESGVTYQGQPLSQASGAGTTKVSMAMAIALNPDLRLAYIRDGSLLDSENMAIVQDMAEANDFMVMIEVVDESGQVGIVIEDGEVAEVAPGNDPEW